MMSLQSQSLIDTIIKIPSSIARKLLIDARQKDVLLEQVTILNQRIDNLNAQIKNLQDKDKETVASYNDQLELAEQQKKLLLSYLTKYDKLLKKEKRKRFWTAAGGLAGMGVIGYLYITK
jgi:hypothetical protein